MPDKYTDLQFLKENTQDNPELMSELIEIFFQTTPLMLDELDRFYNNREWMLLRKSAHKLKSNLFTLGIDTLSAPILKVEIYTGDDAQWEETGVLIKKIRDVTELAFKELELELAMLKNK